MIKGEAVRSFTLMFLQIWNIAGAPDNFDYYLTPPPTSSSSSSGSDSYSSSEAKASGYVIPYGDSPLDTEGRRSGLHGYNQHCAGLRIHHDAVSYHRQRDEYGAAKRRKKRR